MLVAMALVVTLAAAARSTWSPCGLSMLSTLTPLGERARRARFASTAAWFVAGSLAGGAVLGSLGAGAAAALSAAGAGQSGSLRAVAAALALGAGIADLALAGHRAVGHHRQVNERWLDHFRPWVYGAGFGFQIGCGLATYVTTAGVYLVVLFGALSASPALALWLGLTFGFVRGLAVLLGRPITSPEALRRGQARLGRLEPASRDAMVLIELLAAPLVLLGAGRPDAVAAAGVAGVTLAVSGVLLSRRTWWRRPWGRRSRPAGA